MTYRLSIRHLSAENGLQMVASLKKRKITAIDSVNVMLHRYVVIYMTCNALNQTR
jgi:hypothetical protein